jgi:ectoine hydroxylase
MGRVTHVKVGDQTGADPERVTAAADELETIHCLMSPGDALFFHANLLHRSDQNLSENDRWALICCYNARSNSPFKEGRHPAYTPLARVEAEAIKQLGADRRVTANASYVSDEYDRATSTITASQMSDDE